MSLYAITHVHAKSVLRIQHSSKYSNLPDKIELLPTLIATPGAREGATQLGTLLAAIFFYMFCRLGS